MNILKNSNKHTLLIISFLIFLAVVGFGFFGFDDHHMFTSDGGYGGEADTYYIREDGTASKANATDPDSASTSMSVATHNAATFAAGDTIRVSDQGGTIRATLTPPTDGASGNVITYEAVPGESPIISTADINTSWSLQSQETGYAVYRGGPGSSSAKYHGMRDTGATERNPRHTDTATTWSNYTVDRMECGNAGTGYYYIRTDGTEQDPGSVEVGIRQRAIDINDKDYITVDGIELDGPQGRPDGTGVIKDCGLIDFRNGATDLIIQNSDLKYGVGVAVRMSHNYNTTVTGCTIDQCWGGIFIGIDDVTTDRNILITNNEIKNTSKTINSLGDRFCIGIDGTRGVTITENYMHDQGYASMPGTDQDTAIAIKGGQDIEISYNLFKSVAKGGVSYGVGSAITRSNILIMYNIIDDFAKYPVDAAGNIHAGIKITNFNGATLNDLRIYGNTILNANAPGAGSNHAAIYVNGTSQTNDEWHIDNNLTDDNDNMDYELYVQWGTVTNRSINNNCFYQSGDSVSIAGTAETVAELNDRAYADSNIATTPDLDANYHLGASSTCDNAGVDLGATYDDGLDEDTTWSPLSVSTADQDDYGAGWDIGAFISGS